MKNNGIKTGLHVVYTTVAHMTLNRERGIFEVTDSRHVGNGNYLFSLTPVTVPASFNAQYTDVDPDDLQVVGESPAYEIARR